MIKYLFLIQSHRDSDQEVLQEVDKCLWPHLLLAEFSNAVGLFSWVWPGPLTSTCGKSYCFSLTRHFGQFYASNFVGIAWGKTFFCYILCPSIQSKVHKGMVGWVLCWRSWPKVHWTPLGWTRMEFVSHAPLSNIGVWPYKCSSGWMGKNSHW